MGAREDKGLLGESSGGSSSQSVFPNATFTGQGGSGVPFVIAQSGAAVAVPADTNENTVATISVSANALGANGAIRMRFYLTCTNNANAKTFNVRYSGAAGTIITTRNMASQLSWYFDLVIANTNATDAQQLYGFATTATGSVGPQAGTAAIDTTAATTIVITVTKATAGDTITLVAYTAELLKP
jgi:hypothetical protein